MLQLKYERHSIMQSSMQIRRIRLILGASPRSSVCEANEALHNSRNSYQELGMMQLTTSGLLSPPSTVSGDAAAAGDDCAAAVSCHLWFRSEVE